MDSELYLERAENELELAKIIFTLTEQENLQKDIFHLDRTMTFFSAVISHSYYSIFYAAKAHLLKKSIRTRPPEEHKKTFDEFKIQVEEGILDVELLKIYQNAIIRADSLLGIFRDEKRKRGRFTYQQLSQANEEPAKESLKNAKTFFRHIYNIALLDDS